MMRLSVKRGDNLVNELRFSKGPIYIGRQIGSQIFLPDRAVSRQHAVIYTTKEGKWVVEDLDSANKTHLNDKAIHKADIKDGDIISIADFTVEVNITSARVPRATLSLDDTLHATLREPQIVMRSPESSDAPQIRLPASRVKQFSYACELICTANNPQELSTLISDIVMKQLMAFHVLVALREKPSGAMVFCTGKSRDGKKVSLDALALERQVATSVENGDYLLIPRMPLQSGQGSIRSAIIAPVLSKRQNFGVIYADNSAEHEHYSLSDLDYLMLLSIQAAAMIKRF